MATGIIALIGGIVGILALWLKHRYDPQTREDNKNESIADIIAQIESLEEAGDVVRANALRDRLREQSGFGERQSDGNG